MAVKQALGNANSATGADRDRLAGELEAIRADVAWAHDELRRTRSERVYRLAAAARRQVGPGDVGDAPVHRGYQDDGQLAGLERSFDVGQASLTEPGLAVEAMTS